MCSPISTISGAGLVGLRGVSGDSYDNKSSGKGSMSDGNTMRSISHAGFAIESRALDEDVDELVGTKVETLKPLEERVGRSGRL
ncbi:hypothetical protein MMC25_006618 [Agyrium rufum]|nr:hypothetical protein [Agyrium rufum]